MTMKQRLEKLERQNRRLMVGLVLLVILVGALFVHTLTSEDRVHQVVRARAFHVVGEDGQPLVKVEDSHGLDMGRFGTVTTLNAKGDDLVQVGTSAKGEGMVHVLDPANERQHGLLLPKPPIPIAPE
jgi:hypothetical protein